MVTTLAGSGPLISIPHGACAWTHTINACMSVVEMTVQSEKARGKVHTYPHFSISSLTNHVWCRQFHRMRGNTTRNKWNRHGPHEWRLLCYLLQQYYLQDNIIRYVNLDLNFCCLVFILLFYVFVFWWDSPYSPGAMNVFAKSGSTEAAMELLLRRVSTDPLVLHLISRQPLSSLATLKIISYERSHPQGMLIFLHT